MWISLFLNSVQSFCANNIVSLDSKQIITLFDLLRRRPNYPARSENMTDPDWADVKSVRAWLEKRYPVANNEMGSPFFQYLRDEFVKGSAIKGRERHFSKSELLKWLEDMDITHAFHYPASGMRITYYPEYIHQSSESRSQSPTQNGDSSRDDQLKLSIEHHSDHANSRRPSNQATTKPRKRKPARKSKIAKTNNTVHLSDNLSDKVITKKSGSKKLPRTRKPKAASSTKGMRRQISPGTQKEYDARVSTLRDRKNCTRGKTGGKCPSLQ